MKQIRVRRGTPRGSRPGSPYLYHQFITGADPYDAIPHMLVDDIGDVTITNDGATILRMLEVEHPAAKILVELAEIQGREVGDGTTSVVIIAAELLKSANELVRNKIHPTSIISGYGLAMREACKYVEEKLSVKVDKLGKNSLKRAKTGMS
ncbi:hypothetical protein ZWY2020_053674 [Hordeum vulgare]|nr:hypothetical protein ZWY2020_053674 [Hordeum vulgare]